MKVLQVSYFDLPGRRFNGYDLLDGLEPYGVSGTQAVITKWSDDPRVIELLCDEDDRRFQHLLTGVEERHSLDNVLYPWARRLLRTPEFQAADAVHYHIVHQRMLSLLDLPMLFSSKPSVWTFHDPWPLTGHCVQPEACLGWLSGCSPCPHPDRYFPMRQDKAKAAFELKREVYAKLDIDIVVASEFMLDMVQRSPLTAHFERVHLIPFGVDAGLFSPAIDRSAARHDLGIPEDHFVVMFRESEWPLKGLHFIIQALMLRPPLQPTTLLTVDKKGLLGDLEHAYPVLEMGLADDELLPRLYAAADVFLMPSTAESFGLMAVEAMSSGRPVICFEDTAVATVAHAPECGFAVPLGDAEGLRGAIDLLAGDRDKAARRGEFGRRIAEREYVKERHLEELARLYRTIVERGRTR